MELFSGNEPRTRRCMAIGIDEEEEVLYFLMMMLGGGPKHVASLIIQ